MLGALRLLPMPSLFRSIRLGHVIALFSFGFLLSVGLVSAVFFAKGAGLGSTNVQPASLDTGSLGNVSVSFTTATTVPANGKIKVTFPAGFNVSGVSGGFCSSMDGTFSFVANGQTVTLTRQNNGTDQTAAAETCTINNIVNPSVTGATGTYTIETTDATDVQLDIDNIVASDSIVAAALTGTNVEPASLVASTTNVVTVTFTTKNALANNGKVKVTFPAGFNVSGASGGACSSMDGSFVTSVSGQEVTLTRSGGTSEPVGAQTCTINNIVNPASTGSTGTYTIQTSTNANQLHDSSNNVSSDTITGVATLTSTNVQPASLEAGSTVVVTASFTTTTQIPVNGKIKVTFPSGFNVSGASGGACSSMDGTFVTAVNGQEVTLTRQNDGTIEAIGEETCTINGIVNPSVNGSTGTYTIRTTANDNLLINEDTGVAADTLVAGVLTSTNVQPASLVASTTNVVTVTFTTKNALENNGKVKVTFPAGFNVSGVNGVACSSMDGSFTFGVAGQEVTINRNGAGTSEPAGAQTCTINNVVNPASTGSTGTYSIQTSTNSNQLHDVDGFVAADTITSGASSPLTSTNVEPASLVAGVLGNVTVSFTTATNLPANGKIRVTFPNAFSLTGVNGGFCSTMDGSFTFGVSGQVVTLTRQNDGTIQIPAVETCTIQNVRNPLVAGSTGTYTIDTTNNANAVIDTDAAVTADTIIAATLTGTNVQPASLVAGASGQVTVTFTTINVLEADGKIKIGFPSGFTVSGATGGTCSSMDGSFVTSVNGQEVILTRSGGTSEPAGAQTCTVGAIVNPPVAGLAGTYALVTTTALNGVHDQDAAVVSDTIVAATLTSTNVQPASLVAGASGQVTATFTTVNVLKSNGVVVVTFPAGFTVSGATGGTCSSMDGSFATSVSGQQVFLTRSGGTNEPAGAQTCTINAIVNPSIAGLTGTYAVATTANGGSVQDNDMAVAADTMTSGAFTGVDIDPLSSLATARTTVAISFTSANLIESDGKIKVTFPERFTVIGATSGTCSSMDGAFATSVDGQTVILTRAGGTNALAGAHTCSVSGIVLPFVAGLAGNYSLVTTNALGDVHDYVAAIEGDVFSRGSSDDAAASPTSSDDVSADPAGVVLAEFASSYQQRDFIPVSWTVTGSAVDAPLVNLSFSIDGGVFWSTIAERTKNDGGFGWIAPMIDATNVLVKIDVLDSASILTSDTATPFLLGLGDAEVPVADEVSPSDTEVPEEDTQEPGDVPVVSDTDPSVLADGTLFRSVSSSATYYLDSDGKKRVFLDEQTFLTYAVAFDDVQVLDDAVVAAYPNGAPMMPREASVLVKIPTVNKVFAIERLSGVLTLRWITTEAVATALYGNSWKDYVIDILVDVWAEAVFGDDITSPEDIEVQPGDLRTREELNPR